eukprot:m.351662 g.351662  ORF g.351662 m.351662 type:complete len:232 (-) comp16304_c0_seq1:238-933(-)
MAINRYFAAVCCVALLLAVPASADRRRRSKKSNRDPLVAPPGACPSCSGVCMFQERYGCNPSRDGADVSCWYCAVGGDEKDPVAPANACQCSVWADGCKVDKDVCTYTQANTDATCWECKGGAPDGACTYDCTYALDKCEYYGRCGDKSDPACYYCESRKGDYVKAPAGACSECGGALSADCVVDRGCNPLQLYTNVACYECASGSGSTLLTTRRPKNDDEGRRRRRRRRK